MFIYSNFNNFTSLDSPTPISAEEHNRSLANSFKEKLVISRKNTRKGANGNSDKGVFGTILGSRSSSTTTTNSNQQLYDDGSNAIYPPPQKQTGQRYINKDFRPGTLYLVYINM